MVDCSTIQLDGINAARHTPLVTKEPTTMPTLNDLAIAYDLASLAYDRSPTPATKVAMLDAQRAHDDEIRAIDARQREAMARAQAVAS